MQRFGGGGFGIAPSYRITAYRYYGALCTGVDYGQRTACPVLLRNCMLCDACWLRQNPGVVALLLPPTDKTMARVSASVELPAAIANRLLPFCGANPGQRIRNPFACMLSGSSTKSGGRAPGCSTGALSGVPWHPPSFSVSDLYPKPPGLGRKGMPCIALGNKDSSDALDKVALTLCPRPVFAFP